MCGGLLGGSLGESLSLGLPLWLVINMRKLVSCWHTSGGQVATWESGKRKAFSDPFGAFGNFLCTVTGSSLWFYI